MILDLILGFGAFSQADFDRMNELYPKIDTKYAEIRIIEGEIDKLFRYNEMTGAKYCVNQASLTSLELKKLSVIKSLHVFSLEYDNLRAKMREEAKFSGIEELVDYYNTNNTQGETLYWPLWRDL